MLPRHDKMKILRALAFLVVLAPGAAGATLPDGWLTSLDEAIHEAKAKDRLILVDLFAEWCGWCKRLESEVYSTLEFQQFAQDLVLLQVDTEDGDEGTRLQDRYGVISLPTTLILDKNLVKVGEIEGFAPAISYIRKIEHRIASYRELEEGFERFSQSSDPAVLTTLASEFHQRGDGHRASTIYRQFLSLDSITSEQEIWIRYQLSDALRLAQEFDHATSELVTARKQAKVSGNKELLERIDLLDADIALDRGDCRQAREAFQAFLGRHPVSDLRKHAKRAIASIDAEKALCT
jgi:thiol-disulfide isomerase/thioredoxin